MLAFGPHQRYYFYRFPTDMRKGADGLSGIVVSELGQDVLSGDVFIFTNRLGDKLKLLVWDRSGFVVYYKRLEGGTFEVPAVAGGSASVVVTWDELVMILEGIKLSSVRRRKRFQLGND